MGKLHIECSSCKTVTEHTAIVKKVEITYTLYVCTCTLCNQTTVKITFKGDLSPHETEDPLGEGLFCAYNFPRQQYVP